MSNGYNSAFNNRAQNPQRTGLRPSEDSLTDFKEDWIKGEIKIDTIKFADKFGLQIKNGGLTTSQIRNVFGEMRRIQMKGFKNEKTSFLLLKPKLAYSVKRNDNKGLKDFYEFFKKGFDIIAANDSEEGEKQFNNFMQITEAILAYHKFYGGKE